MYGFEGAIGLMPASLRVAFEELPPLWRQNGEEFRLRRGRAPTLYALGAERQVSAPPVGERELAECLALCCGGSAYAVEDELRQGYVSAPGGHRLGLCGRAVLRDGTVSGLRELSSLCLRIARPVTDAAAELEKLVWREGRLCSCLILAPPGRGKSTALRDLVRRLSLRGVRISVADERGELGGAVNGRLSFDLGPCTDVLTGCPKAEAVYRLLRCMSPRAVAVDEITAPAEAECMLQAAGFGAEILATAHAFSPQEALRRPLYRQLLEAGVFSVAVFMDAQRRMLPLELA